MWIGNPGWTVPTSLSLLLLRLGAAPPGEAQTGKAPVLELVADVPLPGGSARFDYQSLDPATGRLYIAHMGAGRLLVFDTRKNAVIASAPGFPGVTGVLAVPSLGRVYAAVTGRHELVVVEPATLQIRARISGIRFPDGIAYAPEAGRIFVSDEFGRRDVVVDAGSDSLIGSVELGGEAGNTQYDSVAKRILVAVQTRNELVSIDPSSARIGSRYRLPGADHPHGFAIDAPARLAFVSCEGNARLLVVDLNTMRVIQSLAVGDEPDVLAMDAGLNRLYVASESGVVTVFQETGRLLNRLGEYRAPGAHSVAVDPATHRVYLPLKNVGGRPVLRILSPGRS
jgi:DNA-binding beta-propeller fold protein YncE